MNNFEFKKSLGQNFLIDNNIITKIMDSSDVDKDTFVIEIGPGAGALTKELAKKCGKIVSFEIDKRLQNELSIIEEQYNNLNIVYEDFLKVDLNKYIDNNYNKIYVIANIPYYITTPIIMKITESSIVFHKIIIMVQKEFAERLSADVGNKAYNSLSVFLKYYYDTEILFEVSRDCFMPKPNVDSAILCLKRHHKHFNVNDEEHLFKLIKDSFRFKRKNLRNNTKEYDQMIIADVLKKYEEDLNIRAEQISLELFIEISNKLTSK